MLSTQLAQGLEDPSLARQLLQRKKAIGGKPQPSNPMAKKNGSKKKGARRFLSPSDLTLEVHGDEDEVLVEEEEEVRPSSPSASRTLGDWDTDTAARLRSSRVSLSCSKLKQLQNDS